MRRTASELAASRGAHALAMPSAALTLAVCAAAVVSGCSGAAGAPLPAASPAAASPAAAWSAAGPTTPASPAPRPARQQVIDAMTGYTVALGAADKSRDPAEARRLLQPFLAASRVDGMVQTMSSIWAKGEVFYGQDILHVLSVTVRGTSAVVHDCDDTSGMGLRIAATGQEVQGSSGVPAENVVTTLALTAGRWLVQFQLIEAVPCTA